MKCHFRTCQRSCGKGGGVPASQPTSTDTAGSCFRKFSLYLGFGSTTAVFKRRFTNVALEIQTDATPEPKEPYFCSVLICYSTSTANSEKHSQKCYLREKNLPFCKHTVALASRVLPHSHRVCCAPARHLRASVSSCQAFPR